MKIAFLAFITLMALAEPAVATPDQYDDIEAALNNADTEMSPEEIRKETEEEIAFSAATEFEKRKLPARIIGATALMHGAAVGLHLLVSGGGFEATPFFVLMALPLFDVVVGTAIGNTARWKVRWVAMAWGAILGNGLSMALSMTAYLGLGANNTIESAYAFYTFAILYAGVIPVLIPTLTMVTTYLIARKRNSFASQSASAVKYYPPSPTIIMSHSVHEKFIPALSFGTVTF